MPERSTTALTGDRRQIVGADSQDPARPPDRCGPPRNEASSSSAATTVTALPRHDSDTHTVLVSV